MGACCGFLLLLRLLAGPSTQLEVLGWVALPTGTIFENTEVGGLSGLVAGSEPASFYALSDDGGERAPARFYSLEIDLGDGRLEAGDVRIRAVNVLRRADGSPYPAGSVDPEGFARTADGRFFFSSEGPVRAGVAPFVREIGPEGGFVRELTLPDGYSPSSAASGEPPAGVRHNLSFESLTPSADGTLLWAGLENALVQDGPEADLGQRSPARLLAFDLRTGRPVAEHLYWTEPLPAAPIRPDGLKVNGLVDLLALPDGDLLALERAYADGAGFHVRLYRVSLSGATNLLPHRGLGGTDLNDFQPVTKTLLADLAGLGIPMDNYEAIAWGPHLPDGRRTLILMADNNFNVLETTWVVALAWGRRR